MLDNIKETNDIDVVSNSKAKKDNENELKYMKMKFNLSKGILILILSIQVFKNTYLSFEKEFFNFDFVKKKF